MKVTDAQVSELNRRVGCVVYDREPETSELIAIVASKEYIVTHFIDDLIKNKKLTPKSNKYR
ncbi:hypothetical protein M0R04_11685 [Candidatus Dojkabacteria bacterium]|jgi:hypothetical protein|nr:hypothetical protein [Candidatus Dojkabacteria bacterium]